MRIRARGRGSAVAGFLRTQPRHAGYAPTALLPRDVGENRDKDPKDEGRTELSGNQGSPGNEARADGAQGHQEQGAEHAPIEPAAGPAGAQSVPRGTDCSSPSLRCRLVRNHLDPQHEHNVFAAHQVIAVVIETVRRRPVGG
jgi:hypothetical protein